MVYKTVGDLRKFLKGLPRDAKIYVRQSGQREDDYRGAKRFRYDASKDEKNYGHLVICEDSRPNKY